MISNASNREIYSEITKLFMQMILLSNVHAIVFASTLASWLEVEL